MGVSKVEDHKVTSGQPTLTKAEKEEIRKKMLIQAQKTVFRKFFPELHDKNSVKYPIDDKLIQKWPEMHGQADLKPIPEGREIVLSPEKFENLIYIWEFFNNFSDFFNIANFTIQELQSALSFTHSSDEIHQSFYQEIDSSQEITNEVLQGYDWHQKCTINEIRERGFHLINQIH